MTQLSGYFWVDIFIFLSQSKYTTADDEISHFLFVLLSFVRSKLNFTWYDSLHNTYGNWFNVWGKKTSSIAKKMLRSRLRKLHKSPNRALSYCSQWEKQEKYRMIALTVRLRRSWLSFVNDEKFSCCTITFRFVLVHFTFSRLSAIFNTWHFWSMI